MPDAQNKGTLVLLNGHHTTFVHGQSPQQLENDLREYRREGSPGFFYIQTPQHGDNGVCVDPEAVVGFVSVG